MLQDLVRSAVKFQMNVRQIYLLFNNLSFFSTNFSFLVPDNEIYIIEITFLLLLNNICEVFEKP